MERFKKKKLALFINAVLAICPAISNADTYEWNNQGTDYNDPNNWSGSTAGSGTTIIIGNTDQTIITSMEDSQWLFPNGINADTFIVGSNGGNASIHFERDNNVAGIYSTYYTEMLIGNGTGSVGEVALLGSSKLISEQGYSDTHSGGIMKELNVGYNGGIGRFIVDGTGFNAGAYPVSDEARIYIGNGLNSVGEVSVLGGGKLFTGSPTYTTNWYNNPEVFNETNVGVAQTLIGYDGGKGSLLVSGKNDAGTATSRAYLWTGTVVGSGDQSVGQIIINNGGILNAAGYSYPDPQAINDLNLNDMAFVIGHNDGTGYVTVDNGTLNVATNLGDSYTDYNGTEYINAESTVGDIKVGYSGHGILVIKNQGVVSATQLYQFYAEDPNTGNYYYDHKTSDKQGLISIGEYAGSKGELFIGSYLGDAVSEAGFLNVSKVQFDAGEGSVNFNHSNQNYVFDTPMESLTQGQGDVNVYHGVTIFNPIDENAVNTINSYSGSTTLYGGELRAGRDNVFSANSFHDVKQNSVLNLNNYNQTIDSMKNGSLVSLSGTSTQVNTQLVINGDYVGDGGQLLLDTVLGNDYSSTDNVIINGQASGKTYVAINNAGGLGAQTINGIRIITTQGSTNDAFEKFGRIVAGIYEYDVVKNGNDWYLTSHLAQPDIGVHRPEGGAYIANLAAANTLFVTRLHDRLGETQYTDFLTGENKVTSLWLRQEGGHNRSETKSGQSKTLGNRYVIQMGGDIAQWSSNGLDRFHLGVMAGYGYYHGNTHSEYTNYRAKSRIDGYSTGLYGTWYANQEDKSGLYVDSWLQYAWFNNTIKGDLLAEEEYDSKGWSASLELGHSFKLGSDDGFSYWLQPKAQVTWMGVGADTHYEVNGTKVTSHKDNLSTRLGLRGYLQSHNAPYDNSGYVFQPFVEANWIYNSRSFGVDMNGVSDYQAGTRNIGELKVGLEANLNQRINMWGNVSQQLGGDNYSDTQATVGFKYSF